ncbi:hypothetical protein KDH_48950 [Dictyobacter sp. S3.2.2.5]|uniref:Uncharacterized protein n=1 Tax=Dictyobacter halimunensis TaxID=3026934 RepID=A0ABQ6FUX4_9CHLR|nr:hypothetical protein KDH_48950 [Dictyobacter sp. S3.2.2.5]
MVVGAGGATVNVLCTLSRINAADPQAVTIGVFVANPDNGISTSGVSMSADLKNKLNGADPPAE